MSANRSLRGFTLVEMLVVLGIIAVLVALLMPAVMSAVNNARRAAIGAEISALDKAIEQYKQKRGDYPPNFRQYDTFIRHVRKCYPKINQAHLNTTIEQIWGTGFNLSNPPTLTDVPRLDEGESLVFWLYLVDNDPLYPFKAAAGTPTTNLPRLPRMRFWQPSRLRSSIRSRKIALLIQATRINSLPIALSIPKTRATSTSTAGLTTTSSRILRTATTPLTPMAITPTATTCDLTGPRTRPARIPRYRLASNTSR